MGEIFEKKGPTLQRLISFTVETLSPVLYEDFVNHNYWKLTMASLVKKWSQFKNYPNALYTTDVIFQQANRLPRTMLPGKVYFSGKHKLYSYKIEVHVAPTQLDIDATQNRT